MHPAITRAGRRAAPWEEQDAARLTSRLDWWRLAARRPPRLKSVAALVERYSARLTVPVSDVRPARATPARTAIQRRLDAFLTAARPEYRVNGRSVRVATGFRMLARHGYGPTAAEALRSIEKALSSADAWKRLARAAVRVVQGKGRPEHIRRITQALIDAGALGPGDPVDAIRRLQFEHGIGLDCSGYAFQAFHAARGSRPAGDGLPARVRRVRNAVEVRAGDLIVLGSVRPGGAGHKVVVSSHLVLPPGALGYRGKDGTVQSHPFFEGGPVHVFEVDSSWGNSGRPGRGGVARRTWLLNESTGRWAYFDHHRGGAFTVSSHDAYEHRIVGIFRSR